MSKKRNIHSPEFKSKVAVAAIKGMKTASEIASQFHVHPTQINAWKKQALEALPEGFRRGKTTKQKSEQELTSPLYDEIGRLKMELTHSNLVWSTDLTYVPISKGFMYLIAIIDWYSRYVIAWGLSNTMDVLSCAHVLDEALLTAQPAIFNTDQGSQFTSPVFTQRLLDHEILISMDGRGRALDNVFVERLWCSVKYEDIYLRADYSPY